MKNLKVLHNKVWALSYGFILAGLISIRIGLTLGLGRYICGMTGLVFAGICAPTAAFASHSSSPLES
jgi:hypothetical protein